jgi:hypothetical protein
MYSLVILGADVWVFLGSLLCSAISNLRLDIDEFIGLFVTIIGIMRII